MKLDNPLLVRWEYASEERLEKRNAAVRALSRGPGPEDAAVDTRRAAWTPDSATSSSFLVASTSSSSPSPAGCSTTSRTSSARSRSARVLATNGTLIATSVGAANIGEVWELIGIDEPREQLKFARENGEEVLRPHFSDIERHDFDGELVFPDTETLRTFVASTIDRAHLAPQVPEIAEPFRARTQHVIFVARGPH